MVKKKLEINLDFTKLVKYSYYERAWIMERLGICETFTSFPTVVNESFLFFFLFNSW